MPGTTPNGYPYPTGGDSIRDGDNTIRALAEALPDRLVKQRSATAGVNMTTTPSGRLQFLFPTPFDSGEVPLVQIYPINPSPAYSFRLDSINDAGGVSNSRVTFTVYRSTDASTVTSTTVAVYWQAIGRILPPST